MESSFSTVATVTAGVVWGAIQVWNKIDDARRERLLRDVKKVADATHTLSNSNMGAQLKINYEFAQENAVSKHRIADLTKQEGDIASATEADVKVEQHKAVYQEHLVRQAVVDAKAAAESHESVQ